MPNKFEIVFARARKAKIYGKPSVKGNLLNFEKLRFNEVKSSCMQSFQEVLAIAKCKDMNANALPFL